MARPGSTIRSARRALFGAVLALGLAAGAARAEDAAPANPVLLPETGLTVDAGVVFRVRPTHLGADEYRGDVLPVIDGQWGKDLHFSLDDGVQYTALKLGRFKFGPDLEYRQPYNDKLPPRTRRTSDAVETGGFAKVDLTYAELDVRLRKALNGYEGWSGDIFLDTLIPIHGKLYLALEGRLGWADRKFALNAFGRTPLPGQIPVSSGIGDYYTAGVQAAFIYLWRPRTKFILGLSDDVILRPSRAVSGADTRNAAVLLFAVTRRFSW